MFSFISLIFKNHDACITISLIFSIREVRLREVKQLNQRNTTSKLLNWDLNPGLTLSPRSSPSLLCYISNKASYNHVLSSSLGQNKPRKKSDGKITWIWEAGFLYLHLSINLLSVTSLGNDLLIFILLRVENCLPDAMITTQSFISFNLSGSPLIISENGMYIWIRSPQGLERMSSTDFVPSHTMNRRLG